MSASTTSTVLPCTASALRSFLGKPANLPEISDPEIELEILSAPDVISEGAEITFRITAIGLKQKMTHRYEKVTDSEIIEELIDGVMPSWRHRQQIEVVSANECRLTDEITFDPPGGMMKFIMSEERILENIEQGMQFRYETLFELAEAGEIS